MESDLVFLVERKREFSEGNKSGIVREPAVGSVLMDGFLCELTELCKINNNVWPIAMTHTYKTTFSQI